MLFSYIFKVMLTNLKQSTLYILNVSSSNIEAYTFSTNLLKKTEPKDIEVVLTF
jgi:hypothetical protein